MASTRLMVFALQRNGRRKDIGPYIEKWLFVLAVPGVRLRNLYGGNQQKVVMPVGFNRVLGVFLFDETDSRDRRRRQILKFPNHAAAWQKR